MLAAVLAFSAAPLAVIIILIAVFLFGAIACTSIRERPTAFVIWFPITAITAFFFVVSLPLFFAEADLQNNMAPLAGFAVIVFGCLLLIAVGILAICYRARPRKFPPLICWLTVLNTITVGLAGSSIHGWRTAENLEIRVLDSSGKPIEGVAAEYKVFGYGPQGTKPLSSTIRGGPVVSKADGFLTLQSREGRHALEAALSKDGYAAVDVSIGMQYNKWQNTRRVSIDVGHALAALAEVPVGNPVRFSVYMAKLAEIQPPARKVKLSASLSEAPNICVDLIGNRFSEDDNADVRLEFFGEKDEQGYLRKRIRVVGLNGAGVTQVPYYSNLSDTPSTFENVMQVAPIDGYEASIVIQRPGSSGEPTIYVRARDGRTFARLDIQDNYKPGTSDSNTRVRVELVKTSDPSRALLFTEDRPSQ